MSLRKAYVIGSGPNGLTAAIVLAREGVDVTVLEAQATLGGGSSSAALTLPGFLHDVCSAVHPMAAGSPALATFPLERHGLRWLHSPAAAAHPLDDGPAATLERSLEETAARLGDDGRLYRLALAPLARHWWKAAPDILAPPHVPRHPLLVARLGLLGGWPAAAAARFFFNSERGRALFAGLAGHSVLPLDALGSSAIGWVLAAAGHAVGWPIPEGGSRRISEALAAYLKTLGGQLELGREVRELGELDGADAILCDVTPAQLLRLAGPRLPESFAARLRAWRYGPGVFKLDWALDGPIPWKDAECARAATVHLGGSLDEMTASERAPWEGRASERPFVLLAQPSLFDPTRAPAGKHTAWAYCHVPHGSSLDRTGAIEAQVERFAPGFRGRILARHAMGPSTLQRRNANLVGGDITGGAMTVGQILRRPSFLYHRTPVRGLYLCSASTPPGGGVHGMCGWHAARAALADLRGN
ncbi:MAG: NAD(P)/FAD-dependent oxidoreductase [Elusimicrobia bacterium]|nr:NAD(P)/FAD-dependent oxidoreductase [Elusimicrobiota bacterium]